MKLNGKILLLPKIGGSLCKPKMLSGNIGAKTINIGGKPYDGEYVFKPTFSDQIVQTKNAVLSEDIVFKQISVNKTSNDSGGNTIMIGD